MNPVGPRGCYDEAKRFAEAMTIAYRNFHGVDTRIVRIFNTYGPRMRPNDGRIVPSLIGQALRGEPLTVFGDGSQTRSFCYVSDLIDGIHRLLVSDYPGSDEHRQPRRDDRPRVRRDDPAAHGHAGADRQPAPPRGRPEAAAARHLAREDARSAGSRRSASRKASGGRSRTSRRAPDGRPAAPRGPGVESFQAVLFTLSQVLVLFCALLAASLGVLALLLLRWNRARAELGLYAALAFAVAFWLATPLLTPVPIPLSREILGRLVRALSFLLPAIGFLFLLRILGLGARGLRLAVSRSRDRRRAARDRPLGVRDVDGRPRRGLAPRRERRGRLGASRARRTAAATRSSPSPRRGSCSPAESRRSPRAGSRKPRPPPASSSAPRSSRSRPSCSRRPRTRSAASSRAPRRTP